MSDPQTPPPGTPPTVTALPDAARERLEQLLADARKRLEESHGKVPAPAAGRRFSEDADTMTRHLADSLVAADERFEPVRRRLCLVALGGYARRELNLHSDVDLIFLHEAAPDEATQDFIRSYMYPLWNLKVEVGYTIRTVEECVATLGADLESATSLINARALWGNEAILGRLEEQVRRTVHLRRRRAMAQELLAATRARHKRYSGTILLLEPNLKESPGALRDLHTLEWVAFILFGKGNIEALASRGMVQRREVAALEKARAFLMEARNGMHLLEGRKADLLSFERQMRVAAQLGHERSATALPEEQLMRAYYDHASVVSKVLASVLRELERREGAGAEEDAERGRRRRLRSRRVDGVFWQRGDEMWIEPADMPTFFRDNDWLMHLFSAMALHGLEPDEFTLAQVEDRAATVDDDFRSDPAHRDRFLQILGSRRHSARVLRAMHRSRFLEAYVPEFALVRNLPRIDYYHQFTVDEHLLRSVEVALRLLDESDPLSRTHPGKVAQEILRWDLLALSLLMHDAGKGEGRGHVIRGAHMMQRIGKRLAMGAKECQVMHDLVLNHQRISHVALHRNSEDPKAAEHLARDLGSRELLRMLYVHTCCDMMAVSGESWNEWRASLLRSLYERTMEVLRGRGGLLKSSALPLVEAANAAAEAPGADGMGAREAEEFLASLPERYRSATPPQVVVQHIALAKSLGRERRVAWMASQPEGGAYGEVHCVAQDLPGLFSNLSGALSSRGFNILSAQVYTAKNGVCIDVFQVQNARGGAEVDEAMLQRLGKRLNEVLVGKREVDWKSQMPPAARAVSSALMDLRPPSVSFHDDEELYSVIEVKAPDRPGLLHDIATVLDGHRLAIHLALASTESYQVVDVFYVTDWDNNRLEPGKKTEELRRQLLEVISPVQTVG
jgi:[protein-PII] uridylyltransferase